MRQSTRKFQLTVRVLILAILVLGTVTLAPSLVSAEDGDTSQINQSISGIEIEGFGEGESGMTYLSAPDEETILFEQALIACNASYKTYSSDANIGYLCMDDFWGLSESITDIHWYGYSMRWLGHFVSCDPAGMEFEIIFYQDSGGAPGTEVATFSNISHTVTSLDSCFYNQLYRFDVDSLPTPVNLAQGWVSIQSTYSPNACSLLWLNSPDGNLNAIQTGSGPTNDNLSFTLTGQEIIELPVGGTALPVNNSDVVLPWVMITASAAATIVFVVRKRLS